MPDDEGYLRHLGALLRETGSGIPRLVVDLDRVDRNLAVLADLQAPETVRIVAKSLPSPSLLAHVFGKLGHERLMVFHLPFLLQLVDRFPGADVLMGKPLPLDAVCRFYRDRPPNAFDDTRQLQWLVDDHARLLRFVEVARDVGRRVSISLELDIGMHRGGVRDIEQLARLLDEIRAHRTELRLAGFMGYDSHVPKAPWPLSAAGASRRAQRRYARFLEFAWTRYPDLEEEPWCVNGAGSPTIAMHGVDSPLNDFSVGSALVKPSGFDLPSLAEFAPAAWIAAPVLKRLQGVSIPFLERLPSAGRDTLFIYGGKWMAEPVWPQGLRENRAYGRSSNQQMLTVPRASDIAAGDYVLLRPTQSEAVLLQFGDLFVTRGAMHVTDWPVLTNSGFPVEDRA